MLKIQNLVKSYEDTTVVDDVTLDIAHGKVVSMIGPNGAGKSTVLGMISRLIARSSGLVEFKGKDVQQWESRELAKHLAILTQTNNVQMKLTVRELVAFGRFPHSGSALTAEDEAVVEKASATWSSKTSPTALSMRCQAASGSAPLLRWSWRRIPSTSCWTNPRTTSTSTTPRR